MASTMAGDRVTRLYGKMTEDLVIQYGKRAKATMIKHLDPRDVDRTAPRYVAEMNALGRASSNAFLNLSKNYIGQFAEAEGLTLPTSLVDKSVVPFDSMSFSKRMIGAGVNGYKHKLSQQGLSMMMAPKNNELFLASAENVAGDFVNHCMRSGKDTVCAVSVAAPQFSGFGRCVSGNACDFCLMLATRSNYKSEESASFESHRNCGCVPEPISEGWTPSQENLDAYERFAEKEDRLNEEYGKENRSADRRDAREARDLENGKITPEELELRNRERFVTENRDIAAKAQADGKATPEHWDKVNKGLDEKAIANNQARKELRADKDFKAGKIDEAALQARKEKAAISAMKKLDKLKDPGMKISDKNILGALKSGN